MGLKPATGTDRVVLLGFTAPRAYEAGSMGGRSFPAGRAMRVCVGTEDPNNPNAQPFNVLKVKNDDVDRIWNSISMLTRGAIVDIEYVPGDNIRLVALAHVLEAEMASTSAG